MPVFLKWGDLPWIEVFDFNFDANSPLAPLTNTARELTPSGPPRFGDVSVFLGGDLQVPGFFEGMAETDFADAVIRTAAVPAGEADPTSFVVHEIHLGRARLTRLADTAAQGPVLSFSYEEIRITRLEQDDAGTPQPQGSFERDLLTNDPVTEAITPLPPLADIATDGQVPTYFMAIHDVGGGLLRGARKGWFELLDFELMLERTDGASGPGALRADSFRVTVADQTGLTALLALAANGTLLQSVEIEGRAGGNVLRSEMRFGDVSVDSISEDAGNGYEVAFRFDQITTQTFGPDGRPGAIPNLAGFDLVTQSADGVRIPAPVPVGALETKAPVRSFLALDGLRGDAVVTGHEKWFSLDDFDLALFTPGGTPQLALLTVSLSTDTGYAALLERLAAGVELAGATISGVDAFGAVVQTLDLGSVRLAGLVDLFEGGLELQLTAGQVELTSRGLDGQEALRPNPGFGWDFETNAPLAALDSTRPLAGGIAALPVTPQKYYMLVHGMNGGSQAPGRAGWFELDALGFLAFVQGGAPSFSELSVSTAGDQGLTAMFRAAATGDVLRGLRVEGVVTIEGEERRVYELALSDVVVQSLQDSRAGGYETTFDYDRFTLRTFDGLTGKVSGQTGWDRVTDAAFTGIPRIAPGRGLAEAQASEYLLALKDIRGDSQTAGFTGLSDIIDFGFGLSRATLPGGPQGAASFDTLKLHFATDTMLPTLLVSLTTGKGIEGGASLIGLGPVGSRGTLQKVLGIDLDDISVTGVTDLAGAGFLAEFDVTLAEITQPRFDPVRDRLGAENAFGWDVTTAAAADVVGPPNSQERGPAITPTGHVLAIAGLNGDLTGPLRGGWLAVGGLSFGAENVLVPAGASEREEGRATFDPLTLDLLSDRGLTELLDAMSSGTPLTELRIDGTVQRTTPGGKVVETVVQAYDLGEVYVTGIADRSGPGYSVTLEAASLQLTHYNADAPVAGPKSQVFNTQWNQELSKTSGPSGTAGPGGSSGADLLVGSVNDSAIDGLAGNDTIDGGVGNDSLFGGADNDRLFGKAGKDSLFGGDGNDILLGGADADALQGGANRDFFEFERATDSGPGAAADTILDFRFGPDLIDLRAVSQAVLAFVGTAGFTGTDQVRVAADGASSIVQVNLFGDTAPEMEIRIANLSAGNLGAGDFLL